MVLGFIMAHSAAPVSVIGMRDMQFCKAQARAVKAKTD
jgi:hypothetical protein